MICFKNKNEIIYQSNGVEKSAISITKEGILFRNNESFNYMINDKINSIALMDKKSITLNGIIKFETIRFDGINIVNNTIQIRGIFKNFNLCNETDGNEI